MALLPDGPIDTLGVRDAIERVPQMIDVALAAEIPSLPASGVEGRIAGTVLVAKGATEAIARAAQALVEPFSPQPVLVHTGHGLPGFVSDAWRVVIVGGEDSPRSRSSLERAHVDRAEVLALGAGPLVDAAAAAGATTVAMPPTEPWPAPRYAFAPGLVLLLRLLEEFGSPAAPLGDGDVTTLAGAARDQVVARLAEGDDAPARLARRVGRTLPLVYGVGPLGAVVARRWKSQFNLDAKVAAFAGAVPDLIDHELSGWGQHGDMTRQVFTLLTVRHDHERPDDAALVPRITELVDEVVAGHYETRAAGTGAVAQVIDLAVQGDLVGFHLAQENEIDPGPTSVDQLL